MAVYSSRAEWLEAQSRSHFQKLGSLTVKTADVYFMGKFAAHAQLEKAGINAVSAGVKAIGAAGKSEGTISRIFGAIRRRTPAPTGMTPPAPRPGPGTQFIPGPAKTPMPSQGSQSFVTNPTHLSDPGLSGVRTGADLPGRVTPRPGTSTSGYVPEGVQANIARGPSGFYAPGSIKSMPMEKVRGIHNQAIYDAMQAERRVDPMRTYIGTRVGPRTMSYSEAGGVLPTSQTVNVEQAGVRSAGALPTGAGRPLPGAPVQAGAQAPAATASRAQGMKPVGEASAADTAALDDLRRAGVSEEHLKQLRQTWGGLGRLSPTSALARHTPVVENVGGTVMRSHLSAHKFNAVLLDIIERSKPSDMIKAASLRATIDDEGILKVASEDSYWLSARGQLHLNFLAGVCSVDPEMAWTFAKNAGLEKDAGIVGGIGKLFGTIARGGRAVSGGAASGARWAAAAPGRLSSWASGASHAGGLTPFDRAAGWTGGKIHGAGQAVARRVQGAGGGLKQQFTAGYQAGRVPAPTAGPLSQRATGLVGPGSPPPPAMVPRGTAVPNAPVGNVAPPPMGPRMTARPGEPALVPRGGAAAPPAEPALVPRGAAPNASVGNVEPPPMAARGAAAQPAATPVGAPPPAPTAAGELAPGPMAAPAAAPAVKPRGRGKKAPPAEAAPAAAPAGEGNVVPRTEPPLAQGAVTPRAEAPAGSTAPPGQPADINTWKDLGEESKMLKQFGKQGITPQQLERMGISPGQFARLEAQMGERSAAEGLQGFLKDKNVSRQMLEQAGINPDLAKQLGGKKDWGTLGGFGRGVRNLGYGTLAAGTVLGGLGLSAAGKVLDRGSAPYQYGMGAPQTWNYPQQM